MKKSKLSPDAQKVWRILTQRQKQKIQKDYPLKEDRNIEIRRLFEQGIKQRILSEITGLSRVFISRIVNRKTRLSGGHLSAAKINLKELQKAAGRLGHHIMNLKP